MNSPKAHQCRDEADDILPPPDPMEMDFLAMPGTDFADLPDMPDMPDIPLPGRRPQSYVSSSRDCPFVEYLGE